MKIQMTLTIDLGDSFIDSNDQDERDWLFNCILKNTEELCLHSNEIGDSVGTIISVDNIIEIK